MSGLAGDGTSARVGLASHGVVERATLVRTFLRRRDASPPAA